MKRDIKFAEGESELAVALGVTEERRNEFDEQVGSIINSGGSLQEVVETMNERGDLSDAEWTALCFALGFYASEVQLATQMAEITEFEAAVQEAVGE